MAASTTTETLVKRGSVGILTFSVVADSTDGTVLDHVITKKIAGRLLALETKPGATAPTTLYDITVTDADGHDVIEGVGADRSATATEKAVIVYSGTEIHPPVGKEDQLTLKIANNSVNSAIIVVKIYFEGQVEGEI